MYKQLQILVKLQVEQNVPSHICATPRFDIFLQPEKVDVEEIV